MYSTFDSLVCTDLNYFRHSFAALGNLGSVLSSQGRYEEAKLALQSALAHRPTMADAHFNL